MKIVSNPGDPINPSIRIMVRQVWAENLESEFKLIRDSIDEYPNVSMDTEFPGVCFREFDKRRASPAKHYSLLKQNVDVLNIIQIGLTLTDSDGNLPDFGSNKYRYIWQFNFRDFDLARDPHASDSVDMLGKIGVDFEKNRELGVDSVKFAELMMSSGLVCNEWVTWVTFHCAYDFGYLVKILTQSVLPVELKEFLHVVRVLFGEKVYDVKYMIRFCKGLYGGLDRVASALKLHREVGCSHQSGSDSLLTWRVFHKIRDFHFTNSKVAAGVAQCSDTLLRTAVS